MIRPKHSLSSDAAAETTEWTFDTVIDWDDVYCLPPILSRRPPRWLWDFSDDAWHSSLPADYDGDIDLVPLDLYTSGKQVLSPEDKHIKDYFEQQYVRKLATIYPTARHEDYDDQAYGRGRWIRRLARFIIHGVSDQQDWVRCERLVDEWGVARKSYEMSA